MKRLHRLLGLRTGERGLLARAALLLAAMRLGLLLLPFQMLRRLLGMLTVRPTRLRETESFSKERIVWAVENAARHIPLASTCLTQALAAQMLLVRRGYPALLHIGIVTVGKNELQAHAWVESAGEVVIGGFELERYTPLATLEVGNG
jgi:hypothetical protein